MKKLQKILGHTAIFVGLYLVFMIPTYILPYMGSNSSIINAAGAANGIGMNPVFWLHLASLIILVILVWFRGINIDKKWLLIFPILALVFDLVPGLSSIPLVPTVMHLLAIILGVVGAKQISSANA
jgi:hypothetical protein